MSNAKIYAKIEKDISDAGDRLWGLLLLLFYVFLQQCWFYIILFRKECSGRFC